MGYFFKMFNLIYIILCYVYSFYNFAGHKTESEGMEHNIYVVIFEYKIFMICFTLCNANS